MAAPFDLDTVPWSFVMAFASLALIYALFRTRADVFEDLAFSGREVALLCLGSTAGWAVNLPFLVIGGTYLAVNVGGTLVPLLLIAWWVKERKLRIIPTILGSALVTYVAWRIVEFSPEAGIVARFPYFFLPIAAALLFGLLVSLRKPVTSVPIVYASGTLGALIGADVLHVADIRAHFLAAPENTIISIGGAGVFDMVFLAGTFAMALNLAIVALIGRKRPDERPRAYPPRPMTLPDSPRVWREYQRIDQPTPLDRAVAGLALSDLALRQGEYERSVRMSWFAVESILQHDGVRAHVADGAHPGLKGDLAALGSQYAGTRDGPTTLRAAGVANVAAKTLVASLAPRTGLQTKLEATT